MREHNNRKKEWVSATLMTSAVLVGLLAGGTMKHREPSVFAQTDESSISTESSDKTASELTINAVSESEKKALSSESVETKATTIKKSESQIKAKPTAKTTLSSTATTRASGYVGPKTEVLPSSGWNTSVDYASKSATTFVSQSGRSDRPDEPVMYFGNNRAPFQPNEFSNNTSYGGGNKSSWAYTFFQTGINPESSILHGLIKDGTVSRRYNMNDQYLTAGIEGGISDGSITDYHLYKNNTNTGFKATMYDTKYNVSYTFESAYGNGGGIYRYFSITNNDSSGHNIGALETNDTFVDSDNVSLLSVGPNKGFKMDGTKAGGKHVLSVLLNDPISNAKLGGWTNYTGIPQSALDFSHFSSFFTGGTQAVDGTGMENTAADGNIVITNIANPSSTVSSTDTAYIMKAKQVYLAPGATLANGSYLTYDQVTRSNPPVATVKYPIIDAYASQKNITITGSVSDPDASGTKGHIEIGYPDGTSSLKTDNLYDAGTAKSTDYSVTVDSNKLKSGENKLLITAIDSGNNRQVNPVTVTVNVIKLGATAIPQQIGVGGTVTKDETKLIKDLTIINHPTTNAHTLTTDSTNPSNKQLINTKVGFYIKDMLLTDTVVKPNEIAKVAVPVTVTDDDTVFDKTSALYAKGFDVTQVNIQKLSTTELTAFILKTSEAKSWLLATGAESKVSVESTTLKSTSTVGSYQAVIKNSDGLTKTINIEVIGGLKIISAPESINYGSPSGVMLPYSGEDFDLERSYSGTDRIDISNAGKQAWTLTAQLTKPLTNVTNDKLTGVLEYINPANGVQDIESGSTEVVSGKSESIQEVSWAKDQGIIAQLSGKNSSLKVGTYTGEITWTLEDTP